MVGVEKKMALGIYPLDNIKLPIDYLAIEPDKIKFKPLEANKEMSGLEILQRHPTGKEYAHLLKGKIKFPVFMDSNKKILSMPPIINSEETGRVNEKTKDIFVECSGFDEKILEKCLNIIVTTLADMGGKIYKMKVGTKVFPQLKNEKRTLSLKNTNKLLGLDLKEKELKALIEKMGHNFLGNDVEIASWRTDILHEVDLIEDVAIAYGYDNLQPVIPKISTIGAEDSREAIKRKISDLLIGLGLLEVSNYHLTRKEDQFSNMGILEKNEKKVVELSDSKTDYSLLRKDLTHYLLKIISENSDAEYPQKIFETGIVFEFVNGVINEKEKLAVAVTPGNLTIVEQILNYLSDNLELNLILKEIDKNENHFIEGRVGGIYCGDSKIGEIGEIHPKILKNWKIKMPVSLFELDLTEIFKKFK